MLCTCIKTAGAAGGNVVNVVWTAERGSKSKTYVHKQEQMAKQSETKILYYLTGEAYNPIQSLAHTRTHWTNNYSACSFQTTLRWFSQVWVQMCEQCAHTQRTCLHHFSHIKYFLTRTDCALRMQTSDHVSTWFSPSLVWCSEVKMKCAVCIHVFLMSIILRVVGDEWAPAPLE